MIAHTPSVTPTIMARLLLLRKDAIIFVSFHHVLYMMSTLRSSHGGVEGGNVIVPQGCSQSSRVALYTKDDRTKSLLTSVSRYRAVFRNSRPMCPEIAGLNKDNAANEKA
ncbi:hypothetical protein J6590_005335 [Homalodisca vitripennis]|nr:hypothetical protein J6590_005335 [Homalodisca vitripennis]